MTALAGLWCVDGRPDAAASCARMLASQAMYASTAPSQWSNGAVALGSRRFHLLPEDSHDRQPFIGADGRYVLVADIRLDNRDELAAKLNLAAERVARMADAALLLSAIERWGDDCFPHLLGDYAFALWDNAQHRLLLARDPIGRRPLHYHRGKDFIAFASMPKGLHALPEIPYAADEERAAEHLMWMPWSGPRSFFKDVERVELGHVAIFTHKGCSFRDHWSPKEQTLRLRRDEYAEGMREHLDRAVAARLRGVGDVAVQLSSGLDSGAVTATAARLLAPTHRRIVAFTAIPREGFDGPVPQDRFADESAGAASVAALYPNIEHVLVRSEGRSPFAGLDRYFLLADRPAPNLCNSAWGDAIAGLVQNRKLSVLLTGSSGNAGLTRQGTELLPQLFRQGRWLRLRREARALVRNGHISTQGALAMSAGPYIPGPLWSWLLRMRKGTRRDIFSNRMVSRQVAEKLHLIAEAHAGGKDKYGRPRKGGFADNIRSLRFGDPGNSVKGILAGWGFDLREPLSDARLLEFCWSIPPEEFLSGGIVRSLSRYALSDRLPESTLTRLSRGYQAADWYERATEDRGATTLEVERLAECGPAARVLDLHRMQKLMDNWPTTGWEKIDVVRTYRTGLARGVAVGHFLRKVTGTNA